MFYDLRTDRKSPENASRAISSVRRSSLLPWLPQSPGVARLRKWAVLAARLSPLSTSRTRTVDPLLTMEVLERHASTRAITRDTHSPANRSGRTGVHASREVARVVSAVSVLCPRAAAR